ncbi:MAG: 4-(cytidine 5'-diphospho)-2-C-methyl-D-erythritol kinase [Chitinophagaceae bacterium]|nr:4-(cytidine 5'-diphospho)-2-C-methyl-D-erythritol kinase [Chitinophagaceae bacterium]
MIAFPNCKINLGLNILAKREDGFHDIETVFYPVNFTDALEITASDTETSLQVTGLELNSDHINSCTKAYQLLKSIFPQLPPVNIHLHKAIPSGAGLGGGSADASATLQLLDAKFDLQLSQQQLADYALALGSDCPFFILNRPCIATGRGEILKEVTVDLTGYKIFLVNPGIHINTADAFSKIIRAVPHKKINEIIIQPVSTWQNELTNDFEAPLFSLYPQLSEIKNDLYKQGATYAAMSGSGSTIYGIFKKEKTIIAGNKNYFYKTINDL